ncbi:Protein NUCLEAR FUSION DEFECTIVE 6 chloroplastic/mitochondrial-like [Melia azedarach]|uniref:Protein NUCLEAR FUSION DEFECTIVE 6 chloroplastic/mitochondrial-like n=1 Tax=Melia azedarach TaxID=155640 RepID=A0ACC1XHX8_MELAZ|nr:Protein NUCLEAR FUSION DEFECTIVE 6 chloroplastic/mitochondrial-like [Melia azedarach]
MAANCGRRTLQLTSASAKTLLSRSSPLSPTAAKLSGLASPIKSSSASRLSSLRKLTLPRLPVELGGAFSLMPLHSVTASALFTSLLSLQNEYWGCLSEGFATPL